VTRVGLVGVGLRTFRAGARRLGAAAVVAAVVLAIVAACQPSAPPGFTGSVPPDGGGSAAPGASVAAPSGSLVAGKPTVTTSGATVTAVGLDSGRTPDFDLPAGSAQMTVSVCESNKVIPFVTLYDAKDNKLSIVVEPSYTLTNLAGGSYYLDVVSNPGCVWQIVISPG
jgi:hypothetical protein